MRYLVLPLVAIMFAGCATSNAKLPKPDDVIETIVVVPVVVEGYYPKSSSDVIRDDSSGNIVYYPEFLLTDINTPAADKEVVENTNPLIVLDETEDEPAIEITGWARLNKLTDTLFHTRNIPPAQYEVEIQIKTEEGDGKSVPLDLEVRNGHIEIFPYELKIEVTKSKDFMNGPEGFSATLNEYKLDVIDIREISDQEIQAITELLTSSKNGELWSY